MVGVFARCCPVRFRQRKSGERECGIDKGKGNFLLVCRSMSALVTAHHTTNPTTVNAAKKQQVLLVAVSFRCAAFDQIPTVCLCRPFGMLCTQRSAKSPTTKCSDAVAHTTV